MRRMSRLPRQSPAQQLASGSSRRSQPPRALERRDHGQATLVVAADQPEREGQQMAQGARIDSVVMFVRELDRSVSFYLDVLALEVQVEAHRPVQLPYRSVSFYLDVLALEVADRSPTAALLAGPGGTQLI